MPRTGRWREAVVASYYCILVILLGPVRPYLLMPPMLRRPPGSTGAISRFATVNRDHLGGSFFPQPVSRSQCSHVRGQHCRIRPHRATPSTAPLRASAVATETGRRNSSDLATDAPATDQLLHPDVLCNGTIPYPKSLSPSSILEFQKCPQSFLFQYLYGLKQPTTLALAKGRMVHAALEQVFDLAAPNRTLVNLQNLLRQKWKQHRNETEYAALFTTTDQNAVTERKWGQQSLQLLEQYYALEDPRQVRRPNPVQREVWVTARLAVDPDHNDDNDPDTTFLVRGIVDRLDMVQDHETGDVVLQIIDYKTGAAPHFKYAAWMNEQIRREALEQLVLYALLLQHARKKHDNNNATTTTTTTTLPVRFLRLVYLTNHEQRAQYVDHDLGATAVERHVALHAMHGQVAAVWRDIVALVAQQDATAFVGCRRSFCYCHACRPRFVPGTIWEPPPSPPPLPPLLPPII